MMATAEPGAAASVTDVDAGTGVPASAGAGALAAEAGVAAAQENMGVSAGATDGATPEAAGVSTGAAAAAPTEASPAATPAKRATPAPAQGVHSDATRLGSETIHVIAQSVPGMPPLSDDAAAALAPDAEYRIREIVQDALKFTRHAKRRRLTTGDVNAALRLRNVEPLYGFGHARGGHSAANSRVDAGAFLSAGAGAAGGAEGPAPGAANGADSSASPFSKVDGIDDLYFVEDASVNLKALIEAPLPAVPLDYAVSAHWLAVDGVQPALPQNPPNDAGDGTQHPPNGTNALQSGDAVLATNSEPVVKPRVKHILGKELQLYYEHLVKTLPGKDANQTNACLMTLAEEPGLVQLVPYFVHFVRETVHKSLRNLPLLFTMMRMSRALLDNPHFDVEQYLHQLLPSVLTCLVGKRLCANVRENHWALRCFSAEIVAQICIKYGPTYTTLQPRITKTLRGALRDPSRALSTHYGAIVGLGALGYRVVDSLLIPLVSNLEPPLLQIFRETKDKRKAVRRKEAARVYGALVWAKSISMREVEPPALLAETMSLSTLSKDEISIVLPSYVTQWEALEEEYGNDLRPMSVSKDASHVSASLYEAAVEQHTGLKS